MSIDIVIFAVIAAFLVYRLRSVLGTRHGDEQPRINPYVAPQEGRDPAAPQQQANPALSPVSGAAMAPAPRQASPLQATLYEISAFDPYFDPDSFRMGAGEAYKMIVQAFGAGDRAALKPLLSDALYADFDRAIAQRESRGENSEAQVNHIKHSEIIDARIDNKMTYVTVEFTAEEKSVTRDRGGNVISGSEDEVEDMIDIWTFARPLRASDPNWILVATRSH